MWFGNTVHAAEHELDSGLFSRQASIPGNCQRGSKNWPFAVWLTPCGWLCVCVRVSMFAVSTMCVRVSADPLSSALCVAAAFVRYLCAALCLINAASSLNVCAATSRTMHKFGRVTANPAYSLSRSASFPLSVYAQQRILLSLLPWQLFSMRTSMIWPLTLWMLS